MAEQKVHGDYAWVVMALCILGYDLWAMNTKKAETMSSALWRSLEHPMKSPFLLLSWGVLTHHLFMNKRARKSLKVFYESCREIV